MFSSNGDHYKLAASDITRSIRGNNSKVTEVSGRTEKQCERSMKASYDFICESDQSWELRKEIFQKQEAIQIQPGKDFYYWKDMGIWFQNNYEPNFSCRHERRIGRPGDGGAHLYFISSASFPVYILHINLTRSDVNFWYEHNRKMGLQPTSHPRNCQGAT